MKSWRTLALLSVIFAAVIFLFVRPHAAATRLAASLSHALQKVFAAAKNADH